MTLSWLAGLVARRRARLVAAAAGVAVAVALIASIGAFLAGSTAAMTDRALARVPLDWQVQAEAGASLPRAPARGARLSRRADRRCPCCTRVPPATTPSAGGATSTASAGLVLGMPGRLPGDVPR